MQPSEQQGKNYIYFQKILPQLLSDPQKVDKYVIIQEESVKGLFDAFSDAYRAACAETAPDFIVQQVVDESKIANILSQEVLI